MLANFWMSYFSQSGHEENGSRENMRLYLLRTIDEIWATFSEEFSKLWREERTGILYQASLFEDRGDQLASEQALHGFLNDIWVDMLGFAGVEIHRRILGLAHNADFEQIAEETLRANCEAKALKFGRHIAVNRSRIHALADLSALAMRLDKEIVQ
jgi:5-methylthioribose kinase